MGQPLYPLIYSRVAVASRRRAGGSVGANKKVIMLGQLGIPQHTGTNTDTH